MCRDHAKERAALSDAVGAEGPECADRVARLAAAVQEERAQGHPRPVRPRRRDAGKTRVPLGAAIFNMASPVLGHARKAV